MRRFMLVTAGLCLLFSGCCSCDLWCYGKATDDCECYCCGDGSDSPKYRPPGPWWKRPDCGCPRNCASYQDVRKAMRDDEKALGCIRGLP